MTLNARLPLALLSTLFLSCLDSSTDTGKPEKEEPKGLYGTLVDGKGKRVAGAAVRAVPVAAAMAKGAGSEKAGDGDSVVTDSAGIYVFDNLAAGTYNLQGDYDNGSLAVLIKLIQYAGHGAVKEIGVDTLRAAGRVTGQVRTLGEDQGGIVCSIPGTSYLGVTDDSGSYAVSHLPPGVFALTCRKEGFLSVSEASVLVQSDKQTVVESKTLEPDPAFPPPAPGNPVATFDTATGRVRLTWNPVRVADLDGYWVYRNEATSIAPRRISPILVRDTTYLDSTLEIPDTARIDFVYRLKAQDKDAKTSQTYSKPDTVATVAPLRVRVDLPGTLSVGERIPVRGTLQSGLVLTSVEVKIRDGSADVTSGKGFVVSLTPLAAGRKTWNLESDAGLEIFPESASPGRYLIRVTARAGSLESADSAEFELADEVVSEKTLTAGAQLATVGAFIDLDTFQAHGIAVAQAMAEGIDLVFAFSTSMNSAAIYSPYAAKNGINGSPGFSFLEGLNPANKTEIRQTKGVFDSIDSQIGIDSLWNSGMVVPEGRLLLVSGTVFLAKSDRGRVVLLKAEEVVQSTMGTAKLVGKSEP